MFGKKKEEPTQSQSQIFGNVNITGGQFQVGMAGRDLHQAASGQNAAMQEGLTGAQAIDLLEQLAGAIAASGVSEADQKKMMVNLEAAKQEAGEKEPDKVLMGANLEKIGKTMKSLKETTDAGKSLWQTGGEILKTIAPFAGLAASLFV
jgi:hypothetical protein